MKANSSARLYVMEDDSGFIKVGISTALPSRLKQISSDTQKPVRLAWTSSPRHNALDIERTAHSLLLNYRIAGEWFATSTEGAIKAIHRAIALVDADDLSLRKRLPCVYRRGAPPKCPPLGIHMAPEERAALERAALADDRSLSALARKIVAEWLRRNGWLKAAERAVAREQRRKA